MKNIKIYNYFLNNINCSFRIKCFRIFLIRTYVFNVNGDNTIYYRRNNIKRKLALFGNSKLYFLKKKINFSNIDYFRYKIKNIDNLLSEYISSSYFGFFSLDDTFDILESKKKRIINVDSFIRKFCNEEMVTMCFDENDFIPYILKNRENKDYFSSINV